MPRYNISNIDTATPVKVQTTTNHGLITGQSVLISGTILNTFSGGPTSLNTTWTITVIDADKFTLDTSTGGVNITSNAGFVHVNYFNIRLATNIANLTITAATNATPIVITTSSAHGLSTNQKLTISGVTGNTAANGNWQITNINSTQFNLSGSVGNGSYISGGIVSLPIRITTGSVTPASTVSHNLLGGGIVTIAGAVGNTAANGTWRAHNYASGVTPTGYTNTNQFELFNISTDTAIVGNGTYTSGGTTTLGMSSVSFGIYPTITLEKYKGFIGNYGLSNVNDIVKIGFDTSDYDTVKTFLKGQIIFYKLKGYNPNTQTYESWVISEDIVSRPELFNGNKPSVINEIYLLPPSGNPLVNIAIVARWLE